MILDYLSPGTKFVVYKNPNLGDLSILLARKKSKYLSSESNRYKMLVAPKVLHSASEIYNVMENHNRVFLTPDDDDTIQRSYLAEADFTITNHKKTNEIVESDLWIRWTEAHEKKKGLILDMLQMISKCAIKSGCVEIAGNAPNPQAVKYFRKLGFGFVPGTNNFYALPTNKHLVADGKFYEDEKKSAIVEEVSALFKF